MNPKIKMLFVNAILFCSNLNCSEKKENDFINKENTKEVNHFVIKKFNFEQIAENNHLSKAITVADLQKIIADYADEYILHVQFNPAENNGHYGLINGIEYSPCGRYLASCSGDDSIKLWDMNNNTCIHTFTNISDHYSGVQKINFSRCGRYLAACSHKFMKILEIKNKTCIFDSVHVSDLAYSPCNKYLAVSSNGISTCRLEILDTGSNTCIHTFDSNWCITALVYSPCGKYLAAGSSEKNLIKIIDTNTFSYTTLDDNTNGKADYKVTALIYSPCGKYLASASSSMMVGGASHLKIWEMINYSCVHNFKDIAASRKTLEDKDDIMSLAYSPCGKYLVIGSWVGLIKIWDINNYSYIHTLYHTNNQYIEGVSTLTYSPCGKYLSSGSHNGSIKIWKRKYLEILSEVTSKTAQ